MSYSTWTPHALLREAFAWRQQVWRMVESRHIAATMKLVDDYQEQDLLEELLDNSKPALDERTKDLHYLLATPFRYPPRWGGSRFRAVTDPGVFYGAASVRTAAAELGYWRWRFLQDAPDLAALPPVAHSAFCVEVNACAIDLRTSAFQSEAQYWQHRIDYSHTQEIARQAREAGIEAIVYVSVRDPAASWCLALFEPGCFVQRAPVAEQQGWFLAVNKTSIVWRRQTEALQFDIED